MTWLKIDDRFAENPKVSALRDEAFRLHVAALCYCARNLTDGFVPSHVPPMLVANVGDSPGELVAAGLWHEIDGGWEIHNYLEHNPTRAKVEDERNRESERKREWARRKRDGVASMSRDGIATMAHPIPSRTSKPLTVSYTEGVDNSVEKASQEVVGEALAEGRAGLARGRKREGDWKA